MKKLGIHDTLETERCILRIPEESEAQYTWSLVTPNIQKYLIRENEESIRDSQKQTQKGVYWDAIMSHKETQKIIGRISMTYICENIQSIELGYWLSEKYWGQGIVPECIEKIKQFAFHEAGYTKIILICDSRNSQSIRVAEKCGFEKEGELKRDKYVQGEATGRTYFGITKEEYLGKS